MDTIMKIKYYLSPFLINLIQLIRLLISNPYYKKIVKNNRKWKNKFNGQKVFVIANGPSLNKIDKNSFLGSKVIVMNNFERSEWKDQVEIVAHCLGEPFQSPSWIREDLENSVQGTDSTSYWLHFSSKGRLNKSIKPNHIHYVFAAIEPGIHLRKEINLHEISLGYQTTAQLAIQVGIYMGFKEIALVGFDHDWLAHPDYSKHFYSEKREKSDLLNRHSYLEIINMMQRMWIIYYKLEEIAHNQKIKIYNYSKPTFLDVFEQRDLETNDNL
jgi:hypothetical protein